MPNEILVGQREYAVTTNSEDLLKTHGLYTCFALGIWIPNKLAILTHADLNTDPCDLLSKAYSFLKDFNSEEFSIVTANVMPDPSQFGGLTYDIISGQRNSFFSTLRVGFYNLFDSYPAMKDLGNTAGVEMNVASGMKLDKRFVKGAEFDYYHGRTSSLILNGGVLQRSYQTI